MTVLVTGAHGHVGRAVIAQLKAAGIPAVAATREPPPAAPDEGVEWRQADLTRPETLKPVLRGVRAIFLYSEPSTIDGLISAACGTGVERVVLLSSASTLALDAETNLIARRHRAVEHALSTSDFAWTFLRPAAFATNALHWAASIRAEGVVRAPYPHAHSAPIHECDIGAVAVRALTEPGHDRVAHVLTGPESITQERQADLIAEAVGRPVRFEEISARRARALMARSMPPDAADTVLGYLRRTDGVPVTVSDAVPEITGRPARTFAEWAADHRAEFS